MSVTPCHFSPMNVRHSEHELKDNLLILIKLDTNLVCNSRHQSLDSIPIDYVKRRNY